jgi:hypothetical protein
MICLYYHCFVKPILDDRIVGLVQLLNDDISIETARLLVSRMDFSSVPAEDLTEKLKDAVRLGMLTSLAEQSDTLRALVNEWIDSGVQSDGSERPGSRHLSDESVVEYVDGPGIVSAVARPKLRIQQMVNAYQKRHPMLIQLQNLGGIDLCFAPEGGHELSAEEGFPIIGVEAVRLFIQFFDSPWIFRLMRCAKCGTYQLVNAPRRSYVRGWHCAVCMHPAASTQSMTAARKKRWNRQLNACAEAWAKGEPKHADRRVWVVEQANKQLHYADHIKRNFITLHLTKIQNRAERIKHAKS